MAQMWCLKLANSQTAAYFPANSILNPALIQKNTDATKKCKDRGHYFCVGRSKYIKVFPLSNQSPDHTLEAVDKQQWFWPLACGLNRCTNADDVNTRTPMLLLRQSRHANNVTVHTRTGANRNFIYTRSHGDVTPSRPTSRHSDEMEKLALFRPKSTSKSVSTFR
jgi:hypothetical protein